MVPFRAKKRVFRYIGKSAMYRVLRFVTWGGTQFLGLFSVHADVPNDFSVHADVPSLCGLVTWGGTEFMDGGAAAPMPCGR